MLEGEWGIKLRNKVQDTAPEFPGFGINFTNDVRAERGFEGAGGWASIRVGGLLGREGLKRQGNRESPLRPGPS